MAPNGQFIAAYFLRSAWVLRAGRKGEAAKHFIDKNLIVLEAQGLGNLGKIGRSREDFYAAFSLTKENMTRTTISGVGGKFFRFVHDIGMADFILYPSLADRKIHVGIVSGKYVFNEFDLHFPHQRKVSWIYSFDKSSLSRGAIFEINAARTLFKFDKHFAEVLGFADEQSITKINQLPHEI